MFETFELLGLIYKEEAKLRAEFIGPDDSGARDHLLERGFYLDADCRWHMPHGFAILPKDRRALTFTSVESGFDANVIEDAEEIRPLRFRH